MAPFDLDGDLGGDLAFRLAMNSAVTSYSLLSRLEEACGWLSEHGYRVVRLDAGGWDSEGDFHLAVKAALDFPDYYGCNLDAFNDCMRDVATYDYGASREATGTVLVFTGYDAFARSEPRAAQVILDIIAGTARFAMLIGHRMLCLVQADTRFDPVGATPVM